MSVNQQLRADEGHWPDIIYGHGSPLSLQSGDETSVTFPSVYWLILIERLDVSKPHCAIGVSVRDLYVRSIASL